MPEEELAGSSFPPRLDYPGFTTKSNGDNWGIRLPMLGPSPRLIAMNWLAHFALSPVDDRVLMGNWLADLFRRSQLDTISDLQIRQGLSLHELIDTATDRHPRVIAVRANMPAGLRRTGGIVLDVVWDHFLSVEFQKRTGRQLGPFVAEVLSGLERALPLAPEGTEAILIRMRDEDWLGSYSTVAGVELTLTRIGRRLSPNARTRLSPQLAAAFLQAGQEELRDDFDAVWRDVSAKVARSGLGSIQAGRPNFADPRFVVQDTPNTGNT